MDNLWDDDVFEEPTLAPVSKHRKPALSTVRSTPRVHAPVYFVASPDIFCSLTSYCSLTTCLTDPTVPYWCILQAHISAYHATSSDIRHLKELHQTVEQAESDLESCVDALSLLTIQAGRSEQLVASMQVPTTQNGLDAFLGCAHCCHEWHPVQLQMTFTALYCRVN